MFKNPYMQRTYEQRTSRSINFKLLSHKTPFYFLKLSILPHVSAILTTYTITL